jgi:hypothetical protein
MFWIGYTTDNFYIKIGLHVVNLCSCNLWSENIQLQFQHLVSGCDTRQSVILSMQPLLAMTVEWYGYNRSAVWSYFISDLLDTLLLNLVGVSTIQTPPENFISIRIIPLFAPDEPNTLGNRLHILHKINCILHKVFSKFTLHSMRRTDKRFFPPFLWVGSSLYQPRTFICNKSISWFMTNTNPYFENTFTPLFHSLLLFTSSCIYFSTHITTLFLA